MVHVLLQQMTSRVTYVESTANGCGWLFSVVFGEHALYAEPS